MNRRELYEMVEFDVVDELPGQDLDYLRGAEEEARERNAGGADSSESARIRWRVAAGKCSPLRVILYETASWSFSEAGLRIV